MVKRFSETKIWEDEWYQSLPTKWKIAWKYLCDKCDEAGIWKPNFSLADFQIKEKIKWPEADQWLNKGKTRVIITDKAWILKDFVPFQYGDKIQTSSHPFHQKIKRLVEEAMIKTTRKKITEEFKLKIMERDDFICQWCSVQYKRDDLILDHFIPLSKGGSNESENLLTCCIRCNKYKYDFLPKDFIDKNHSFIKPTTKTIFLLDTLSDTLYNRVQEEEEVKEEVNKGGVGGFDFELIWAKYPNKDGKRAAERHFKNEVKVEQDWKDINTALDNYLQSDVVKKGFIKNGSTWFNNWRDWIVPPKKEVTDGIPKQFRHLVSKSISIGNQ